MSAPAVSPSPYFHAIKFDLIDIAADLTTTAEDFDESNLAASIAIVEENYKALGDWLVDLTGRKP